MKINNILDSTLDSKAKIRILRTLFKHPDREFTEREIANIINMSPNTVNLALKNLRKTNVFTYKRIGGTHSYKCNKDSVLFNLFSDIFKKESQIRKTLFETLKKDFESIGSCVIYGSYAKGEEEFDSDLDIMVIAKNKKKAEEKANKAADLILKRYSIVLSPIILTPKEFKLKSKKPFIKEALEHGIVISGKELDVYL
ncbi:MAG: nucleotidyltransferase domain-containing protein [Thermoplasmata archaeon]|nr:MAG: nucleotidyltransferase domain-containing protein [Thermoplasmata archaeon]